MKYRKPMALDIKKGALHRQLGMKSSTPIPVKRLSKLKNSDNPLTVKRATFALNARHWSHKKKKKAALMAALRK